MADSDRQRLYRFGDFVLDTARGVLLENDVEITLRPQSAMVLQVLLENHGRLVSKDDLHERVWGQKAVTDDSLAQCLVDIRRALHDSNKVLVRTLPRRGYLFAGDVTVEGQRAGEAPSIPARNLFQGVAVLAVILIVSWFAWSSWTKPEQPPSIAVLPFVDLGAGEDLQVIGNGLAEDILNSLAHYPELSVVARTSSFGYSTGTTDIKAIGRALNVSFILEGSVRDSGNGEFRIVAQLIEANRGTHVWSEAFDVGVVDLVAVHEQISNAVRLQLAPETADGRARVVVPGFTSDEFMLLARDSERRLRESSEIDPDLLAKAVQRYRDATSVNPNSAKAHAGLARVLLISGDLEGARIALEAAVNADDGLSEVQEVLGRFRWLTGRPGAGSAWKKAVELSPNNVDAVGSYGYWLWMQGRFIEAESHLVKARDLDPNSLSRYADLGNFIGHEARIDEILELVDQIQQRFDSAESYRVIAHLLGLIGHTGEGIAWLARARNAEPDNPLHTWALAELFADIGDYETAVRLDPGPSPGLLIKMGRYQEFIELAEDRLLEDPGDLVLRYLLAFAYNATGEHRLAIWQLERARIRDFVFPEVRQVLDIEASATWLDALQAAGRLDEGEDVLHFWLYEFPHSKSPNWWVQFYGACFTGIAGQLEESLVFLEAIPNSPRLPTLYIIRDAHCLSAHADNPRFRAVIESIEARQRDVREQLPATLQRSGVEIPELTPTPTGP